MKELLLALLLLLKVFFMKTTHVLGQKTEKTKDRNMKINLRQFYFILEPSSGELLPVISGAVRQES